MPRQNLCGKRAIIIWTECDRRDITADDIERVLEDARKDSRASFNGHMFKSVKVTNVLLGYQRNALVCVHPAGMYELPDRNNDGGDLIAEPTEFSKKV
jgi:hypothetical protein